MVRRFEDIVERVQVYNPDVDLDLLRKAYIFSAREHRNQTRRSGEPYLIHPLEVAYILAEIHLDTASIVSGQEALREYLVSAIFLTTLTFRPGRLLALGMARGTGFVVNPTSMNCPPTV